MDTIFAIFAAHEIRDEAERIAFFKELRRVLEKGGAILVTEHLRNGANFLAYQIGFLHFYARPAWLRVFRQAGLQLVKQVNHTPFITTFMLQQYDTAS